MARRVPWWGKLALVLTSVSIAGALGELAARMLLRDPQAPQIRAPGGEPLPLGEIAHFMSQMAAFEAGVNQDIQAPHGRLQAGLKLAYYYPNARWAYFDQEKCVTVAFNSLGFRDDEFAAEKQLGEFRAIALGDSFTHGQGVQQQDSWPQVLERSLRPLHDGPVQVINAGFATGHNNPDGYDQWMASDGMRLKPDLVLVGLCLNDLHNDVPMLSYPIAKREPLLGSVLLGEVRRMLAQRTMLAARKQQAIDLAQLVDQNPQQWQGVQRGLRELQALTKQAGVPFVVAIFPMLSELEHYPYERLHTMARDFCRDAGIRCVDLRHVFDGYPERDLWVDDTDQHPNDIGQRLMAEAILSYLRAEKLVK